MGFLGKFTKSVLSVAVTPIDIMADIATLGGSLSDRDQSYTGERLKKAKDSLDDSLEDLGDGDIL